MENCEQKLGTLFGHIRCPNIVEGCVDSVLLEKVILFVECIPNYSYQGRSCHYIFEVIK